jgi:hypothetical protein
MRRSILGAAATTLAVGGLVLAAPANAELDSGVYTYRSVMADGDTNEAKVEVNNCGPGCISLYNIDTNVDQGQARILGTQYVLDKWEPQAGTCADGSQVDVLARYTFDLDGTNGRFTLLGANPCPNGPVGDTTFTLTRVT